MSITGTRQAAELFRLVLMALLCTIVQASADAQTRVAYRELTDASGVVPLPLDAANPTGRIEPPRADFYQLQLVSLSPPTDQSATLTMEDAQDQWLLGKWTAAQLGSGAVVLTDPLASSNGVVLRISGNLGTWRLGVKVLAPKLSLPKTTQQSVAPMSFYDQLPPEEQKFAASVAKLKIGQVGAACTGFLVADDLLLTAFHCLEDSDEFRRTRNAAKPDDIACSDIKAQFDYYATGDTRRKALPTCLHVVAYGNYPHDGYTKDDGDFALLRFDPAQLKAGGVLRTHLKLSSATSFSTSLVTVIQHPFGFPLEASFVPRGRRTSLRCWPPTGARPTMPLRAHRSSTSLPASS